MSKPSESEPKSLVLKPLVPSDVSQTLSEWKTSAVHFISKSGHGVIAHYIKSGDIPTVPLALGN